MTDNDYEHMKYGLAFSIIDDDIKRYKQYKRNGKLFWRDYKRDVKGESLCGEFMQKHIDEHRIHRMMYKDEQ